MLRPTMGRNSDTRLLILDFDGTFTDAYAEAEPFVSGFKKDLFDLLGRDASADWDRLEAEVTAHPDRYGWMNGSHIAAPAGADPYLTSSCIAQNLFDELGMLQREAWRNEILQLLYRTNYALTKSAPRSDARAVLDDLLARDMKVVVVTNSRTDAVAAKIDELGLERRDELEVYGDAKKFVIDDAARDDRFNQLEDMVIPGLNARKVAIKRGHYYDLVSHLWAESGADPEQTLVCGDIFELDLALPLALGCRVHLVHHDQTPPYEVAFLRDHPRASVSVELAGVLEQI
jgi:FMN phosphatase YigB (HAD superfamily)